VTTYDAGSIEATAHLNRDPFLEGIRQCIREGQRLDGATFTATAKLDTRQAEVAARQLQLLLDRLGATDIDLQVSSRQVDQAAAQVAALRAELARLQREQDKTTGGAVRGSQQRTQQLQKERHELGLMRVAVEQLGPPLIAAGGGAVALGASFAGLALAGVTAFLGVKDAIAQADAQGQMFGGQLNVLKTDLKGVSQASATAIAPGFLQAVDKLHAGVPAVQASLTGLSSTLGDIAQHLAGGLIGGFTQFSGVMQTGADVIDRWAAGFERWATGPGGTAFAHALLVDLQHLVPFLDAAGPALAHLVQAGNGLGVGMLDNFTHLLDLIDGVDPAVLQALATAYIAFRTAVAVTAPINAASAALERYAAAQAVAGGAGGLRGAAGEASVLGRVAAGGAAALRVLGPVAIAATAGYIGLTALANATDSWRDSIDRTKSTVSGYIAVVRDLATLQFGQANADAMRTADAWQQTLNNAAAQRNIYAHEGYVDVAPPPPPQSVATAGITGGIFGGGVYGAGDVTAGQPMERRTDLYRAGQVQAARDVSTLTDAYARQRAVVQQLQAQRTALSQSGLATSRMESVLYGQYRGQVDVLNALGNRLAYARTEQENYGRALRAAQAGAAAGTTARTGARDAYLTRNTAANRYALQQSYRQPDLGSSLDALQSYQQQLQKNITAEQKWTRVSDDDTVVIRGQTYERRALIAALDQTNGHYYRAVGLLEAHRRALGDDQAAADHAATATRRISDAIGRAEVGLTRYNKATAGSKTQTKLTADQVMLYASALGITARELGEGTVSAARFARLVGQVAEQVSQGRTNTVAWVTAIQTWEKSSDTAVDRAALMGQAMVSLQGDTLAYQNTMVAAATANQQLVTDFGKLTGSAINLKKGVLDFHNAAAAPVLNDLQALQTSAQQAAQAMYQHEVSTKGARRAAQDATQTFHQMTYGALVQQAQQLGITRGQAKKLADTYFSWPKDAKTQIEQLGGNQVHDVLAAILQDLDRFTGGHHANLYVHGVDAAMTQLQRVGNQLRTISNGAVVGVTTYTPTGRVTKVAAGSRAAFGTRHVPPATVATVGEQGYEGLITDAQGRATILSNAQARAAGIRPGGAMPAWAVHGGPVPGYAGGTGWFHGVNGGGSGSSSGSGSGSGSGSSGSSRRRAARMSNERYIAETLASYGLDNVHIAAILGNLDTESGFDPKAYNPGENAIGIAQWEGSRRTALQAFAAHRNTSETDLATQVAFLWRELGQRGQRGGFLATSGVNAAAHYWQSQFEVSDPSTLGAREANARSILATIRGHGTAGLHGGGSTTATPSGPSTTVDPRTTQWYQIGGLWYQGLQAANEARALRESRQHGGQLEQVGTGQFAGFAAYGQTFGNRHEAANAVVQHARDEARAARQREREQARARRVADRTLEGDRLFDPIKPGDLEKLTSDAIRSAAARALQAARAAATAGVLPDKAVSALAADNRDLSRELDARDRAVARYERAHARLMQLRSDRSRAAAGYASTLRSGFDIGTSGNGYQYGIMASLNSTISDDRHFLHLRNEAEHLGLRPGLLRQIMSEGPQQAGANLEAIVAGGQAFVNRLNRRYARLQAIAAAGGAAQAGEDYQKRIANAADRAQDTRKKMLDEQKAVRQDVKSIRQDLHDLDRKLTDSGKRGDGAHHTRTRGHRRPRAGG
jgi:hypothetical protein